MTGPCGLHGGECDQVGRNSIRRTDGSREPRPGKGSVTLALGETVSVETPGGSGWGGQRTRTSRDIAEGLISSQAASEIYGYHVEAAE